MIRREQPAGRSHLAAVGLDLYLVSRICGSGNRQWFGFLLAYWPTSEHLGPRVFVGQTEAASGAFREVRLWPSLLLSPNRACPPFFTHKFGRRPRILCALRVVAVKKPVP
jgi:hypothetical protein